MTEENNTSTAHSQLVLLLNLVSISESFEDLNLTIDSAAFGVLLKTLCYQIEELKLSHLNEDFFKFINMMADNIETAQWSDMTGYAKAALSEIPIE